MDRRKFLGWVGIGALASSLPVVLAACNSETEEQGTETESPTSTTASPSEVAGGFVSVGTLEQLEEDGSILDKTQTKPILVIRNPDTNQLSAVNPTCSHKGCTVEFDKDAKQFACPCHGAKYSLDGAVVTGPAERSLAIFEAKEEDNAILVNAS